MFRKNEKTKQNEKSGSSGARVVQMIVQIFPDICPEKNEKMENRKKVDLELDYVRFGSIRLDCNQIVQIFPDIHPGKNEKTKKVNHLDLELGR